jgi:SAM-dependent methyltransferase
MSDAQAARGSAVVGDTVAQTAVLENLSEAINYRRWLCRLAAPWLGSDPLEVGSGLGDQAAEWVELRGRFTASEADPTRLAHLRRRFADDPRVRVRRLQVPLAVTTSHSSVLAFNVLEHINDDVEAARAFGRLAVPGGWVVVLVPAFGFAMGRFDAELGHYRRYTRGSLATTLEAAGLQVRVCHYVNALGLCAWTLGVRVLGMRPRAGPALRAYDALVPALERLEQVRRPPFGQSVFAVARAPG